MKHKALLQKFYWLSFELVWSLVLFSAQFTLMVVELSRGRIDTKAKHDGQSVRKFEVCNFSLVPLFCYIFYFAQISLCLTLFNLYIPL